MYGSCGSPEVRPYYLSQAVHSHLLLKFQTNSGPLTSVSIHTHLHTYTYIIKMIKVDVFKWTNILMMRKKIIPLYKPSVAYESYVQVYNTQVLMSSVKASRDFENRRRQDILFACLFSYIYGEKSRTIDMLNKHVAVQLQPRDILHACMSVHHMHEVPIKAQNGHQSFWVLSYRCL